MPLAGAFAIVSAEADSQGISLTSEEGFPLMNDIGIIGALAAWRVTQGVYRFDPDVYNAVIDTPITGDLPQNILFNLPEWCVYIETPGLSFMSMPLSGFFAYLEYDANDTRKELRLVLDHTMPEHERSRLMSKTIHLGPWSLLESVQKAMQEAGQQAKAMYGSNAHIPLPPEAAEYIQENFTPLVSLLLYICSVNSEIGEGDRRPVRPRSKKTKKGVRIFPPNQVTTWDVGIRMGAALRRAKEASEAKEDTETTMQRPGPKPHVRRAHWHGYWTGPRNDPENRKFALLWLHPILVGKGDVPTTIHPVE